MNEKYSLDDFYNVLLLRNHLEFLSVKTIGRSLSKHY